LGSASARATQNLSSSFWAPAGAGPSARYPALSLAKAREKAKIILAQRALGKHQPGAISWKKAIDQYLDFVKRNRRPHTTMNMPGRSSDTSRLGTLT
jgi:hypothetical protein